MLKRSRRGDHGSVLALVPAGFLVLILLSALAVDSATTYLAQQQLHDALSAAANDAAGAALNNRAFYDGGSLSLDQTAVDQVVCSSIRAQGAGNLEHMDVAVAMSGAAIRLSGSATVNAVFGRAIPGFGQRTVRSTAQAALAATPGGSSSQALGPAVPLQC